MVMEFPREWKLDLNKDGNGNGNTTTWEWERLMLVGPKIIPADGWEWEHNNMGLGMVNACRSQSHSSGWMEMGMGTQQHGIGNG